MGDKSRWLVIKFACLIFTGTTIIGCKGEVPTGVNRPSSSSSSSTDDSVKPDATTQNALPDESTKASGDNSTDGKSDDNFTVESDFHQLLLDQFDAFGAEAGTWTATADGFTCTGKPRGYLYSKDSYRDFTLRLDYRFERPANLKDESKFKGNTGFLVYIHGEHRLWPSCIEIQGKHIQMAAIKENGGAPSVTVEDNEDARQAARKPVGEWNSLEIVSRGGALTATLNGTLVSSSKPDALTEGAIGIQSEDHPFVIRRIRVRVD